MNLETIKKEFEAGFDQGFEIGASVSVWRNGEELMHLSQGFCDKERLNEWNESTLVPVFSATKGPAAAVFLLCLADAGMDLDSYVSRIWPEFPVSQLTFGELLSHQSGIAGVDKVIYAQDHAEVIGAIEQQEPLWEPTEGHGYHPRLGGYMLDECVRRISGIPLGQLWQERVADPYGLEFWIGLPESEDHRVATLYAGKMTKELMQDVFYQKIGQSGSLPHKAFTSPKGVQGASEMNKPENWRFGYPAMGGVGTAQALAKFYQLTQGLIDDTLFPEHVRACFNQRLTNGEDLILCAPTSFGAGFMLDPIDERGNKMRHLIGSDTKGYGHPGAGGSHAFADPTTGYSFAYVMNQMEVSVLPGARVGRMIHG